MTRNKDMRESPVEDILADARKHQISPPPDLVHRVLEDAARVQASAKPAAAGRKSNFALKWRGFQVFGVAGGMVTACCVGFWLGISPPDALEDLDVLGSGFWMPVYTGDSPEVSGFGWDTGEI